MENEIRFYRALKAMSQRQLAEKAGTSQQQIQRIEKGGQAVKFHLARAIAEVLDQPLSAVFPAAASAQNPEDKPTKSLGDNTRSEIQEELNQRGIDPDPRHWHLRYLFNNGIEGLLPIGAGEYPRIHRFLSSSDNETFLVFNTEGDQVAINPAHLARAHLIFEPSPYISEESDSEEMTVSAYIAIKTEPEKYSVEPDLTNVTDDPEELGGAPLQNMIFELDSLTNEDEAFVSFPDEDGEEVFLRRDQLAMIKVPLAAVVPVE